jgi:hypothetical protein
MAKAQSLCQENEYKTVTYLKEREHLGDSPVNGRI